MLRPLAFVDVRQEQQDHGRQIPFVLARADELVDDYLRAVGKIAELRFPQNESLGVIAAEPVFETEAACLGKRGIVNLAKSLIGRKVAERKVIVLGHCIDQNRVALVEGAALRILASQADEIAFQNYASKRQRFRETFV